VRPPLRPPVLAALGAAAATLAVIGAATIGPWSLQPRHYGSLNFNLGNGHPLPPLPSFSFGSPDAERGAGGGRLPDPRWVLIPVALLALGAAGWLLYRTWRRFQRTASPPSAAPGTGAGSVGAPDAEPELPPLLAAAREAMIALDLASDPDDAIVQAWLAVERGAAQSGIERRPAQTATEFTVAVLRRTTADPRSIEALRALYHRARFSAHPATAADLAEAIRCLEQLADSWGAEQALRGQPEAP
jgi:hypothetical protein